MRKSPRNTTAQPAGLHGAMDRALVGVIRLLLGTWAWLVFLPVALCFALLTFPLDWLQDTGRIPRDTTRRLAQRCARVAFRCAGIPLHAEGLEKLPQTPHILVVNHASFVDALALTALLPASPGYSFSTRREEAAQRVFCPPLRSLHTVILKPPGGARGSNLALLCATLRSGENLLVFPEGRFDAEPGIKRFHSGAFVAAAMTRVPLVVAGLRGARAVLPSRQWLPRRAAISLTIGSTFSPPHPEDADRLRQQAHALVSELAGELGASH